MNILRNIFTGPDNETIELAHVLWAMGVITFIGMVVYYVFTTKSYPSNFGQDFLALNAGGSIGSYARAKADQTLGTTPAAPPAPK